MDNFARAQRDWETPPDEPEAVICEECGQEMELRFTIHDHNAYFCENQYCPAKFTGVAKEMAQALSEAIDELMSLEGRVKHLTRLLRIYDPEYK